MSLLIRSYFIHGPKGEGGSNPEVVTKIDNTFPMNNNKDPQNNNKSRYVTLICGHRPRGARVKRENHKSVTFWCMPAWPAVRAITQLDIKLADFGSLFEPLALGTF